ncbi:MAG: hypothetical protein IIZ46_04100 [Clostridia bacterium]|nr:hypothetical protein [Clostridia bacterium]
MGRKGKHYIYKFVSNGDEIELTAKAEGNLYTVERILGKVLVKGRNELFEMIEIKNRVSPQLNGIFLTERKNFNFDNIKSFILFHSNGDRSEQWHPYKQDLKDDTLLSDLGIAVLTYKYFYSGDDKINDVYYVCKKEDVNEELKEELKERSIQAENEAKRLRTIWASREKCTINWENI